MMVGKNGSSLLQISQKIIHSDTWSWPLGSFVFTCDASSEGQKLANKPDDKLLLLTANFLPHEVAW